MAHFVSDGLFEYARRQLSIHVDESDNAGVEAHLLAGATLFGVTLANATGFGFWSEWAVGIGLLRRVRSSRDG